MKRYKIMYKPKASKCYTEMSFVTASRKKAGAEIETLREISPDFDFCIGELTFDVYGSQTGTILHPHGELSHAEVCDVVGGMLRQMERVGDEDVWGVVGMLGDMLKSVGGERSRLGWLLRDMAEVAAAGYAVDVRRVEQDEG